MIQCSGSASCVLSPQTPGRSYFRTTVWNIAIIQELALCHVSMTLALTFQSFNAFKIHLSRFHKCTCRTGASEGAQTGCSLFNCPLCDFKHPFSEATLFSYLKGHLKNHNTVKCPFKNCNYHTNVYSSFNAHRTHAGISDICDDIVSIENDSAPAISTADLDGADGEVSTCRQFCFSWGWQFVWHQPV